MMERYSESKFSWTYNLAGHIRGKIISNNPDDYLLDYFLIDDTDLQDKLLKPNKETVLHEFIEVEFCNQVEYITDKMGGEGTERDWEELLLDYKIAHKTRIEIEAEDETSYVEYLSNAITEEVASKVADEVFTVLFGDRMFLLKLNELLASQVRELTLEDYPDLLEKDGVIKRCAYFPEWVQRAVFLRERGNCAICLIDLTGLLKTDYKDAIDHIVPLNLGGGNDVTNLQLVCQKCNLKKLGHSITTSEFYPRYF